MAETIEFHGGPRHGEAIMLPFDSVREIEVQVSFSVDGIPGHRRGKYTRVHDIGGLNQSDFEWDGYHTDFIPHFEPIETEENTQGDQHD